LKDSDAARLFCPGITAYGAVKKAELHAGKQVAVFGIGGVRHMVTQFALLFGADVIAVSGSIQHLMLVSELRASNVADISKGNREDWLNRIGLIDSSIVFAASTDLALLAMRAKPGGTTAIGVWLESGQLPFVKEKRVVGSAMGSRSNMRELCKGFYIFTNATATVRK
jgi:propanol-preferring alcohol dehydrogenase